MTTHEDVAKAFVEGRKSAAASNMFVRRGICYSYGEHFPISIRLPGGKYLFNTDRYSNSTSRHQCRLRCALSGEDVIECSTNEIKSALNDPGTPVIITRTRLPTDIKEIMGCLKAHYGVDKFPKKKLQNYIEKTLGAMNI